MKYNILFSLNSSYFPYGKMFINSLVDKLDLSNINNIILADTGLTKEQKKFFQDFDKILFLDTNIQADFNEGGTWGKGWQKIVTSKARHLLNVLKKYNTTTVMVDADCIFTRDIYKIISENDIQLCYRGDEKVDNPYLGSYVAFKPTDISYNFLNKWISYIDSNDTKTAKESPMLAKAVKETNIKVQNVPRKLVSCYTKKEYEALNKQPYIIHFKGGSLSADIQTDIKKRIYGTHGFNELVNKYL